MSPGRRVHVLDDDSLIVRAGHEEARAAVDHKGFSAIDSDTHLCANEAEVKRAIRFAGNTETAGDIKDARNADVPEANEGEFYDI